MLSQKVAFLVAITSAHSVLELDVLFCKQSFLVLLGKVVLCPQLSFLPSSIQIKTLFYLPYIPIRFILKKCNSLDVVQAMEFT